MTKPLNLDPAGRDAPFNGQVTQQPNPLGNSTGNEVPPGTQNTDYAAISNVLGWVSLGAGLLSFVTGPVGAAFGIVSIVAGWVQ